jgi:predicted dehydrogenase
MDEIRLAFIGVNDWATHYHLPTLTQLRVAQNVKVCGIWNRTKAKAIDAAQRYGISNVYESLDDAANDPAVHGFVVVIHQSVVGSVIERILPRQIPFLCEKPPGNDTRESRGLAQRVDVPNVVAFNRRYSPMNQRYKEMVDCIRDVYFAECHFYRNERLYKNFVVATGIHGINYLEFLFGEIAHIRTEKWPNPGKDTFLWVSSIRFASGMRGLIKFFPCSGSSVERYEVHSRDWSAYFNSPQHFTTDIPGRIILYKEAKIEQVIEGSSGEDPLVESGYINIYTDFLKTIRGNSPTVSNFANSWRSMAVAESIEKGVPLPQQ